MPQQNQGHPMPEMQAKPYVCKLCKLCLCMQAKPYECKQMPGMQAMPGMQMPMHNAW